MFKKFATAAAAALVMSAGAASAALIDFTDNSTGLAGSIGSANWVLSATPDDINNSQAPGVCPIDCQALGLAMDNDGVGIDNSEVSTFPNSNQYLTLTFSEKVKVSGIAYIDMYKDDDSDNFESGLVKVGAFVDGATFDHKSDAEFVKFKGNGFVYDESIELTGSVFQIFIGPINDDAGQPDAALAAVQISAIPLPAGVLLMMTALGGLAFTRRRKSA